MTYRMPDQRRSKVATDDELKQWNPVTGLDHVAGANGAWTTLASPAGRTERANSRRLVERFGHLLRFVPEWNEWIHWTGKNWDRDTGRIFVMGAAKQVADDVVRDALAVMTPDAVKFAIASSKLQGLRAMVGISESDLAISHDVLDSNPWVFNVQNGTLDLKTGQLRPHNPDDLLTKICPFPFDERATCPTWERVLLDIFSTPEKVSFFQRLAGWWLTGVIEHHLLTIAYGVGGNGKSTVLETLLHVWGTGYAMQAPDGFLMEKKGNSHPTDRADLFKMRLVIATETEGNARLAESLVKQLTGGDRVRARRMRENFWEFVPTHKLVMCTNHKPRVRGTDHGIWRRLMLLPFVNVFSGTREDKKLPATLKDEAAGILAWCVRGCLSWQQDGLAPPPEVADATREYRTSQDAIGRFINECCEAGSAEFSVKFSEFYSALEAWAKDSGETVPGSKTVSQYLQDQGFERYPSNGIRYRGVTLKNGRLEGWN